MRVLAPPLTRTTSLHAYKPSSGKTGRGHDGETSDCGGRPLSAAVRPGTLSLVLGSHHGLPSPHSRTQGHVGPIPPKRATRVIEKLLTAEQVAELLGCTKHWVYAATRRGEIPC